MILGAPHLNADVSHGNWNCGESPNLPLPKVSSSPLKISKFSAHLSTLPMIPSADALAAGAKNLLNASISAWFGPPQALALNSLISGQFGFAHKNASKPRI